MTRAKEGGNVWWPARYNRAGPPKHVNEKRRLRLVKFQALMTRKPKKKLEWSRERLISGNT